MSSCNVRNRNVHIVNSVSHHTKPFSVNSVSHHTKPFSVGKIWFSRNVSKPVIHKSVVVNLSKRARKQSFNVSSHKHGVAKSHNARSILMTSIYFYGLVLLFFIFRRNFYSGNVDNFLKGCVTRNSFSRNEFLNYDNFNYHDVNVFKISHTNVLSSSSNFVNILFLYTVFLMI